MGKKKILKGKTKKNLLLPPTWSLTLPSFLPNSNIECQISNILQKKEGGKYRLAQGTMKHIWIVKQHRVKRYLKKGATKHKPVSKHKQATKHQGATKHKGIVMHREAMKHQGIMKHREQPLTKQQQNTKEQWNMEE